MSSKRAPTTWRPTAEIRVIAIGVVSRGEQILVFEGHDPSEDGPFYRPLGGGVEPGERGAEAVAREFAEELAGIEVVEPRLLGTLENLFTFAGMPGHEIVLVYDVRFADPSLYGVERFTAREESGERFDVLWLDLARARRGEVALYPDGLLDLLDGMP